jgi:hypothetical protein
VKVALDAVQLAAEIGRRTTGLLALVLDGLAVGVALDGFAGELDGLFLDHADNNINFDKMPLHLLEGN